MTTTRVRRKKPRGEAETATSVGGIFRRFAQHASHIVGTPWAFATAFMVVLLWALSGPLFGFSDTWQLAINTSTTIVTFLMVFLIQNTQNRDSQAVHLKLDELIRGVTGTRDDLIDLEDLSDEELQQLQRSFEELRRKSSAPAPARPSGRNGTVRKRR
jgi:low affinity Fe/Cu permease